MNQNCSPACWRYSGNSFGSEIQLIEASCGTALSSIEIGAAPDVYVAENDEESRLTCLRSCLQTLSPDNRDLILQYYQGEKGEKIENRKKLLQRLGIPVNTLRMRALRLRERLQSCVEECQGRI